MTTLVFCGVNKFNNKENSFIFKGASIGIQLNIQKTKRSVSSL